MADVAKKLYQGQPGTSDTLLYTDPNVTGLGTVVRSIDVANTTGSAATITLGLDAGGALAAGNYFANALSIPANGVASWSGFAPIPAGGSATS